MCGICGAAFANRTFEAEKQVRAMTAVLEHRGPDEAGFLANEPRAPGLALGMRRLSIIDVAGGHQPAWNEAKDIAVVFNGEIYNYRELREQLASLGHKFSSSSDTEILVHAWEEWGEDCLPELRGMFAFALLDLRKRYATSPLLFLARDPLGIKPLYYTQTADGFVFASEVRALLAREDASKQISQDALTSYLLFGSVSEPVTLLEGVFSLPPGHRMLLYVPERRRTPRARPWWDLQRTSAARDPRKPRDFSAAVTRVRPLLEDAVRAHLIADVPVGLFLSSGLDSGAIAGIAAKLQPNIESFTLAFPGTPYDEGPLAREVAKACGTKHHEVPLDGDTMLARLDEALGALDQPTMDGVNTYFASWAARQVGLKVALSGLGGDELFAGYRTFENVPKVEQLIRASWFAPRPVRRALAPILRGLVLRTRDGRRQAKSDRCVDLARRAAASVFLRAHTVPCLRIVATDGAALSTEHRERRRRYSGAHLARLARTHGRHSAQDGASRGDLVARNALVHGEHAAARHRFGQHGAIARSARAAARHAVGRIRRLAARRSASSPWNAEGVIGRSAVGNFAAADSESAQAHVHFAVGAVATRTFTWAY